VVALLASAVSNIQSVNSVERFTSEERRAPCRARSPRATVRAQSWSWGTPIRFIRAGRRRAAMAGFGNRIMVQASST
jgi:hypothetical protein